MFALQFLHLLGPGLCPAFPTQAECLKEEEAVRNLEAEVKRRIEDQILNHVVGQRYSVQFSEDPGNSNWSRKHVEVNLDISYSAAL